MLIRINQDTAGLNPEIQTVGCLFLCFAQVSPFHFEGNLGVNRLNYLWQKAKEQKILNPKLEVVNHEGLARIFDLYIKYDDTHHSATETIPDNVAFVFGEYFWKSSHFVVLDRQKQIVFNPKSNSKTVAYGILRTMRWYTL